TLTGGAPCVERDPADPCAPDEGSAYVPVWSPDGTELGYVSALDRQRICLCVVGRDGGGARALIADPHLAVTWFDWEAPGPVPPGAVTGVGWARSPHRLLVAGTATGTGGRASPFLWAATGDLWDRLDLPLPPGVAPRF